MSEFLKTVPRHVYGQIVNRSDGSAITSGVGVSVVVDGGAYLAGAGTLSHKGGGLWEYLPASDEANSDSCVIHFTHEDAIPDRVMFYATPKRIRELEDPATTEIAEGVNALLTEEHGAGDWGQGDVASGAVVVSGFLESALAQLEGGQIRIVSPLFKDGTISLVQGDDYLQADGRSLNFFSTVSNQWPDLTGASVQLKVRQKAEFWQVDGAVVSATETQHLRVELNSTQTNRPAGWWDYQIKLTLANNHQLTIAQGRLQIIQELAD